MKKFDPTGKWWMWSLVLTITVFILFFAGFAIWAFQDDVELVYDNYYAKDVVFDQQIRRVERTGALMEKPLVSYNQKHEILTLRFPALMGHQNPQGDILMFRPADLHKDRLFALDLDGDTLQTIPLPDLDPGLWRVKLSWSSDNLEYYLEQMLMVR